ncbi:hypothetical protein PBI_KEZIACHARLES14_64 [Mycobacterium phage Keziacharles14]|nr:hypothetical protein PBI_KEZIACHARLES14_64 [Mycobacterium phage Keziacharles14]
MSTLFNGCVFMVIWVFLPLTALAWCIDLLERRLPRDKTDESEVDQGQGLR